MAQGYVMPIRPFLAGRAFQPETITDMSAALERTCATLGLKMMDDPATRLIAQKIIELTERGVTGVSALHSMAVQELRQ
jgi:hypothetical protein